MGNIIFLLLSSWILGNTPVLECIRLQNTWKCCNILSACKVCEENKEENYCCQENRCFYCTVIYDINEVQCGGFSCDYDKLIRIENLITCDKEE